jgi:hypothetical protein
MYTNTQKGAGYLPWSGCAQGARGPSPSRCPQRASLMTSAPPRPGSPLAWPSGAAPRPEGQSAHAAFALDQSCLSIHRRASRAASTHIHKHGYTKAHTLNHAHTYKQSLVLLSLSLSVHASRTEGKIVVVGDGKAVRVGRRVQRAHMCHILPHAPPRRYQSRTHLYAHSSLVRHNSFTNSPTLSLSPWLPAGQS